MRLSAGMMGVGIAHFSQGTTDIASELPKKKCFKHKMSDVQYQGDLGTCSCFSCAAAIEAQIPGIKISEAELYIRGKTEGGHHRREEGLPLSILVSILSTGALLTEHFPDYSTYEKYVLNVLRDINGASLSRDYDESIDHFRSYCSENVPDYKESTSATSIPPRYQAPSGLLGLWAAFNPAPKLLIETMGKMLDPARRMRLAINVFRIYQKGLTSPVQFITDLKLSLLKDIPVVVCMGYFEHNWSRPIVKECSNTISLPPSGSAPEDYHAICICGYNNEHSYKNPQTKEEVSCPAVLFKNSWDTSWGDQGYAWLPYEYVLRYCHEAIVIEVQKGT
jgi:hypothetical protein